MTAAEWFVCTEPTTMLEFLRGKTSERKLRLFAVACCRRIWHLFGDERSRTAVDIVEEFLDEAEGGEARMVARAGAQAVCKVASYSDLFGDPGVYAARAAYHVTAVGHRSVCTAAESVASAVAVLAGDSDPWRVQESAARRCEAVEQCQMLRDIIGNPFRPATIDPIWLTPTVLALAQSAYDERIMPSGGLDPERLAVLSDAVEELGCDDEDILEHLRSPGPHVRGCWAVDLILGKS